MFDLYKKQDGVNPKKSTLGCLLANGAMVIIVAAILYFFGLPLRGE